MLYPVDKKFSILLALAAGQATGAEIGQQVSADTLAFGYLQSSSLYLVLGNLKKAKLIEHTEGTQARVSRPFQLTPTGWKVLERSIPQLDSQLQLVRQRINAKRYLPTQRSITHE